MDRQQNPMMSFGDAVKTCFSKYATFKGRARRSEYWWYWLFAFVLSCVAICVDYSMGWINREIGLGICTGILCLALFLPSLAACVRRLHDTGHSGWWYLISFIPLVGPIVLFVFLVSDSKPEENRFGESPKYSQAAF